tara:strand:+ start:540 stop:1937 length:1398 start_codon:yes stop_codon:yes gene_type:complete
MPKYAIVDLETTGGKASQDKIIDVAIFIHDGKNIIDSFSSLVDPEKSIPYNITYLTGINDEMVKGAPFFHEIAKEIVLRTKDCIFVAHNVSFDYGFLKESFAQLGYTYSRPILCTVKESRKWLPGYPSYSLGKLCPLLGIEISARHRAFGDAEATVKLFELILKRAGDKLLKPTINGYNLPPNLLKKARSLPEKCGVYRFYDEKNNLIYVGKSKNIRKRVLQHLTSQKTQKGIRMVMAINDLDFTVHGSELLALLCENDEIKAEQPLYNRAQRRRRFPVGLFLTENEQKYSCLEIASVKSKSEKPILSFATKLKAERLIQYWCNKYGLCRKLCGLEKSKKNCFAYHLSKCGGACGGGESAVAYNNRLNSLLKKELWKEEEFLIVENGSNEHENVFIYINRGIYQGYTIIDTMDPNTSLDYIIDSIKWHNDYSDSMSIIAQYLRSNKCKLINLKLLNNHGVQKELF